MYSYNANGITGGRPDAGELGARPPGPPGLFAPRHCPPGVNPEKIKSIRMNPKRLTQAQRGDPLPLSHSRSLTLSLTHSLSLSHSLTLSLSLTLALTLSHSRTLSLSYRWAHQPSAAAPHVIPICDDLLTGFLPDDRPLRLLPPIQSS